MDRIPAILIATLLAASPASGQMAGIYTIDPSTPASSTNFTSLASATGALAAQGLVGPAEFFIFGDSTTPYMETATYIPGLSLGSNNAAWVLASWPGSSPVNTVAFRAAPGSSPVIDANGQACVIYWNGADYTTIEGLELRNAGFDAICMYTPSTDPAGTLPGTSTAIGNTITRCHIHSCGAVGVTCYANSGQLNDTTISNNLFHTLVTSASRGSFSNFVRDGYVVGRRDSNTRILNNTFFANTLSTASNASLGVIIEYHDGSVSRTGITQIEGNIIYKTSPYGVVYLFYNSTSPPTPNPFNHNCLWDQSAAPVFGNLFGTTYPTAAAWISGTGLDASSLVQDPQLISSVAPLDLHIQAASPCIGAMPLIPGVAVDIDGDVRTVPSTSIGADEYAIACPLIEYAVNSPVCSATVEGVLATPCSPAVTSMGFNQPGTAQISSVNTGFGFEAIFAPAALVPLTGGAFQTPGTQILNVPLWIQPLIFLNGGAVPSFAAPFPGPLTLPFNAPPAPATIAMQVAIIDPTHADFFRLSQGCQLQVP